MNLSQQLVDYVNAAFAGIWIQTHEPDEAEREILQAARQGRWKTAVWDIAGGLRTPGSEAPSDGAGDPLAALRALGTMADGQGSAILVLHNFHRFLNNPEIVQTVFTQLVRGKKQRGFIVVLSPVVQLPVELEKLFVVLDHPLPERSQLEGILREILAEQPDDVPKGAELTRVLDAAAGLTRYEAEGAFSLSLARRDEVRPDIIWELKAQTLKKNSLLNLHRGQEKFEHLGGLGNLKDFCRRALQAGQSVKARGVLLLGPPGSGKSAFAKALGNETGRPTLTLDIGALMASLVGQSECAV